MKIILKKELYDVNNYPRSGRHILAQTHENLIAVYQAYKHSTADYAIANQKMGGPDYSFSRMSWIKPNFLWMMFRSGWAQKVGQERVLAYWITQEFFDEILAKAVISSFDSSFYSSQDLWKADMDQSEVRLQWDPDHDPYGKPVARRAVQLGLKGSILKAFATTQVQHIEDVTPFVHEQYAHIQNNTLDKLKVPIERIYMPQASSTCAKIGLDEKL
jgi:hypothetical protein